MKLPMTKERQEKIAYLLKRAYPRKLDGTRGVGNQEFYAELCEQPDNVLAVLYDSAKQEEAFRQQTSKKKKLQVPA